MSQQQSYTNQTKGFAGQREGTGQKAQSYVNDSGLAAQEDTVTAANAAGSTLHQFEVNGIAVQFTTAASTTNTLTRDGLLAALRAIQELETIVAGNPSGADAIALTALQPGVGYTLTETDANLALASVTANGTTQTIVFGRAVVRRTVGTLIGDQSAALPTATGQEFLGVNERIHSDVNPLGDPKDATDVAKTMTIVYEGRMVVEVDEAVSPGDSVFFRHTLGGDAGEIGTFRTDADTARADQVTGKFLTSTTGAGLAVVSLNGV